MSTNIQRALLLASALAPAPVAEAVFVGYFVAATPVVYTSAAGSIGLVRYELFAMFNGPTDTVLNAFNLNGIGDTPTTGFWHKDNASYNSGILSQQFGTWNPSRTGSSDQNRPYDSFLTIGGNATATNTTMADPSWNATENSLSWDRADIPNGLNVGWYNSIPPNLQGRVGQPGNTATMVRLGQFVLSPGHTPRTYNLKLGYNNGVLGSPPPFAESTFTLSSNFTFTWYLDVDGDGFGSASSGSVSGSSPPPGYVSNSIDCNDLQLLYRDFDGDGFGSGAPIACGGVGNNADCNDLQLQYRDQDGDGFGAGNPVACGVANDIDCDDAQLQYRDQDGDGFGAGTPVACGVASNADCNDAQLQYRDLDGDGFGAGNPVACGVANNADCNDAQLQYRDQDGDGFGAGTPVACGVASNADCNDAQLQYRDLDGDGFGAGAPVACGIANSDDCNDSDPTINPNTVWFRDLDGDGFGAAANGTLAQCTQPAGYVPDSTDNCPAIANPSQADCDSDTRGDACEIASGESTDWDGNTVPDACAGEFVVGATGRYATIQAAVDIASAGTTITIGPGIYGPVDLGSRTMVLRGAGPAGAAIIDAAQSGPCLRMFNIDGAQPLVEHLVLRNGIAEGGGGLQAALASPVLRDCVIEHCGAIGYGGGVLLNGSAALLERCVIRDCKATVGGGLAAIGFSSAGPARLVDCTIEGNTSIAEGGGIFNKSPFVATGCTVAGNSSALGGGIRFDPAGSAQVGGTRFCRNTASTIDGPYIDLGGNIFASDCNGNLVCDDDEIAADPQLDSDSDGELDICERARGDIDLDGLVGGGDLALLLGAWGQAGGVPADIDGDGVVGGTDLGRLLGNWGN